MIKIFIFFLLAAIVHAGEINGIVTRVMDGDTFVVTYEKENYTIRLNHVDAPEKSQEFFIESKNGLSQKIFNQRVRVEYKKKDLYKRYLGDVYINERWINRELIEEGLAFQNRIYSKQLKNEENQARNKKTRSLEQTN